LKPENKKKKQSRVEHVALDKGIREEKLINFENLKRIRRKIRIKTK